MNLQLVKRFRPKIQIRHQPGRRWAAWAQQLARRRPKRPRPSLAHRIFLRPMTMAYQGGSVNHWHLSWRPIFRHQSYSAVYRSLHHHANRGQPAPAGRPAQAATPVQTAARRAMVHPTRLVRQPSQMIQPRLIHQQLITRRQQTLPILRSERPTTVARLLFRPQRGRVEVRPGRSGWANGRGPIPRGISQAMTLNKPAARVFRRPQAPAEPAPAPRPQPLMPAQAPLPGPPPQLDLNKVTDQVMQQIDRRLTIWRERTGRV